MLLFYALPPRAELTFSAGWSIIKVQRWQRSSDGCSPNSFGLRNNPYCFGGWRVISYFYAWALRAELTFLPGCSIIVVQRWQRSSDGCSPYTVYRSNPQFRSLAGYFLFLCSRKYLAISQASVAMATTTSRSCKTSEIFAIITTPLPCGREFMFQKVCFRSLPSSGFGERTAIRRGRYRLCASYSTRFFLFLQVFSRPVSATLPRNCRFFPK